jgi:signal transduction histidine kinase
VANPGDELGRLARTLNEMIARLERSFDEMQRFTADAAHELRTPLAVLRARIDTIPDPVSARPLRTDVDAMGRTVAQLLDIAEMEGLHVREDECADLVEVCADTVAHLAPLALARRRDVELRGHDAPVWVRGNSEALSRALRNLLENAIAHTPERTTVTVEVDAHGTLRVSDEGPGVPPEDRDLIFRRFWRRDRRRTGNAGLGLSIVSRVVEAHGGTIVVHDRVGGGAVFHVDLTAAVVPPPAAAANDDVGYRDAPGAAALRRTAG